MFRRSLVIAGLAALAVGVVSDSALAQFYRGKTITMIINYPAGGPSDIEGRIIAQHLPAHIPGKPTIVIRNVGGAGGVIGTNQLGEAAPNGETIGFFTLDIIAQLLSNPALRVNYADFVMIAGVENPLVAYARRDIPPGLKVATDIMKTKDFKALSLNVQNSNTINQALSLDLLGLKYQAVPAFRGLKEVETAILQNEGQFANTSLPGWRGSIEGSMGNIVLPLWQIAARAQGRQLSAQPGASRFADVRGVLRLGERRQEAIGLLVRGAARQQRPAGRDVPHRPDAAEVHPRSGDDHARRLRRPVEGPRFHPRLCQHREDHPDPASPARRRRTSSARSPASSPRSRPSCSTTATSWSNSRRARMRGKERLQARGITARHAALRADAVDADVAPGGGEAGRVALRVVMVDQAEIKLGLGAELQSLERREIGVVGAPLGHRHVKELDRDARSSR